MGNEFSTDLKAFIRRHIRSVGHLEVVILLYDSPERDWSPEEVSIELRTNPSYAEAQLRELKESGLLVPGHMASRYHLTNDSKTTDLVVRLKHLYFLKRGSVISFIYTQPPDSIRSFADAFRIRKD